MAGQYGRHWLCDIDCMWKGKFRRHWCTEFE